MYRGQLSSCFNLYESSYLPSELLLLQVFQLTTLVICGPPTHGEKFIISVDCVAIKEEEVRGVLLCVQDFVRSPHFTQRSFSSESGLTMLSELVAIADSITSIRFNPHGVLWSPHLPAGSSLFCVTVGIGCCCVVAVLKTPVSAGIMVASLGVRQRQGQG